jgi:hypothetical protein
MGDSVKAERYLAMGVAGLIGLEALAMIVYMIISFIG